MLVQHQKKIMFPKKSGLFGIYPPKKIGWKQILLENTCLFMDSENINGQNLKNKGHKEKSWGV